MGSSLWAGDSILCAASLEGKGAIMGGYDMIWDIFGCVGMAFVLLSFFMPKMVPLRILNLIGGGFCFAYGLVSKTYPTAALNGALVLINGTLLTTYFIHRHKEKKNEKKALEQNSQDEVQE